MKPVIVTTVHRGVFYGFVPDEQDLCGQEVVLKDCRMVIRWGTTRGVMELAETGPTDKSKISKRAELMGLRDVTAIMVVSAEAQAAWSEHAD